jgi:hypothetical protein
VYPKSQNLKIPVKQGFYQILAQSPKSYGISGAAGLTFTYDGAGRLQTVNGGSIFSAQSTSPAAYAPQGALQNALYGTGVALSRTYDNRLRITSETDKGQTVTAATPGSATITITGAEQSQ